VPHSPPPPTSCWQASRNWASYIRSCTAGPLGRSGVLEGI
jgi:hypothetical protein